MLTHRINTLLLVFGIVTWLVIRVFYPVSAAWFLFPFLAWLVITVAGSFSIGWNYHLKALHENPGSERIALTFDDGPGEYTGAILDLLKEFNGKASFFLIGRQVEKYPGLVQRILSEGHTIGNHTYSHSPGTGFM
ncbi:MAG: polysaccharide deacetylase family protein, partial [Leadbetterella sp.]|nr:polysaccharide deacetylase family protein [Leadbetterella sp.]